MEFLAVVVAMDVEESALLERLPPAENITLSARLARTVRRVQLADRGLWILKSGVGAVNAAVGLALLLERESLDAVVSLGVGGALDSRLSLGDVVVARHVFQHDCVLSSETGLEPMAPGHLHLSLPPEQRPSPMLACDPDLSEVLVKLFAGAAYRGTVLSGSEFVATVARKLELAARVPDALLVEMEAAGLAQVCAQAGLPFVAVKTVADGLHSPGSTSEEYLRVLSQAAAHAARLADWLQA